MRARNERVALIFIEVISSAEDIVKGPGDFYLWLS